jgi:hypothetical protein
MVAIQSAAAPFLADLSFSLSGDVPRTGVR